MMELFRPDKPISLETEDKFQRLPFARRIAEMVSSSKFPEALVIGIYGTWGEGKTPVMKLVEAHTQLIRENSDYWSHAKELLASHKFPELAVPLNSDSDTVMLFDVIKQHLDHLDKVNTELMGTFTVIQFEWICLAFPNLILRMEVALSQLEIKYVEEQIIKSPETEALRTKLIQLRSNFNDLVNTAILAD